MKEKGFSPEIRSVEIYDTTLRDGAQSHDVSFSVEDKLRIVLKLDDLGVHCIEGGWPGANPKDTEFFRTARKLKLDNARIAAFGATHHPAKTPESDKIFQELLMSEAPVVTVFGKSWDLHVTDALGINLEKNLEIIRRSIEYLKQRVDRVIYDAEHFFDGYKNNPEYTMRALAAAAEGGADIIVLCDTNGGTLPDEVSVMTARVNSMFSISLGIHAHNDSECAVANSLAAVEHGAVQVQGTVNGLGERCGNANLISLIPDLVLKKGYSCIPEGNLVYLKDVSRFVSEMANHTHFKRQPFVGDSAFAHKGGIHVSAILKNSATYEHIRPEQVGNSQKVLLSDQAGKSNVLWKARDFGVELSENSPQLKEIVSKLKYLENEGYDYGAAEASFELVMRRSLGQHVTHFELIEYHVVSGKRRDGSMTSEATVRMTVGGREEHTAATGDGPVNALDNAMRKALYETYPVLQDVKLVDYKVRVLSTGEGTTARVRVLIESSNGSEKWNTIGVSENIIEASWQALSDSVEYRLLLEERDFLQKSTRSIHSYV
ncbi:MAG: citramalate synthase [Spirochaetales bacterium]|nr:citramalate synthase [Spirochaetales bacterium]